MVGWIQHNGSTILLTLMLNKNPRMLAYPFPNTSMSAAKFTYIFYKHMHYILQTYASLIYLKYREPILKSDVCDVGCRLVHPITTITHSCYMYYEHQSI